MRKLQVPRQAKGRSQHSKQTPKQTPIADTSHHVVADGDRVR
jgi:hypothetical protein